jgi:hypothetical protein
MKYKAAERTIAQNIQKYQKIYKHWEHKPFA